MDYSFMKTGFSLSQKKNDIDLTMANIYSIIQIFTSNAFQHSSEYVRISGRNTITQEDMRYGLINEFFEFIKRNSEDINNIESIDKILKNETNLFYSSDENDIYSDDDLEINLEEYSDNEDIFKRVDKNSINDNDDYFFIEKLHNYVDQFADWQPRCDIEKILRDSINKTLDEQQ